MSTRIYPIGIDSLHTGEIDWDDDTISAGLFDALVYDPNDQFLSDITPSPISTATLTGNSMTGGLALADNTLFSGVSGGDVLSVVVYKDTGSSATSTLLCYMDNGGTALYSPTGGDIEVMWNGGAVFLATNANVGGYETLDEAILDQAPVAYYPMGEASGDLIDASGNGHDAALTGSVVYGVTGLDASAPDDNAVDFQSAGRFTSDVDMGAMSSWTVEMLINVDSGANDVLWHAGLAAGDNIFVYFQNSTGLLNFIEDPGGTFLSGLGKEYFIGTGTHHLAWVYDTTALYTYVDGNLRKTSAHVGGFGSLDDTFTLGAYQNGAEFMDGRMAKVAVYDFPLDGGSLHTHAELALHGLPTLVGTNPVQTDAVDAAGPYLWLHADDLAGADGTAVSSWPDRTGDWTAVQATGTNQPALQTVGTRRVVRFDGSDNYMTIGSAADWKFLSDGTDFCIFIVAKGIGSVATSRVFFSTFGYTSSEIGCLLGVETSTDKLRLFVGNGSGSPGAVINLTSGNRAVSNWTDNHIYSARLTSAKGADFYGTSVDGFGIVSDASANGYSASNPTRTMRLGTWDPATGTAFMNFDLAEMVIFNRDLGEVEYAAVYQELAERWLT